MLDWCLPVTYLHVVFTLPHDLLPLIAANPAQFYSLLFQASAATLKELAKRQGMKPGFMATLHTWGQKMNPHVHLHVLVDLWRTVTRWHAVDHSTFGGGVSGEVGSGRGVS